VIVTRVYPGSPATLDLDDATSRDALLDLYRPESPSTVRVNLIASVTGNAGGADGTSHSLSNPVDRRILGVIRELADVVLIGAESIRQEGNLVPRRTPLAVVTHSGDLSGHGIDPTVEPGRILVLCPPEARDIVAASLAGIRVEIVELPATAGVIDPMAIVTALRVRGYESIVCEGGPLLASLLVDAGLVDELCLSTSPVLGGAAIPLAGASERPETAAVLTQLLVDDSGATYARWSVVTEPQPASPLAEF
jgi:riboflavin biosynthesis pyrimidine reductase